MKTNQKPFQSTGAIREARFLPKPSSTPPRRTEIRKPVLRFSPYAWAKLHFFCHHGQTEIGGFGITAAADPLCIEDFVTVKQDVTEVSVAFEDEAVADFFESQVDEGRKPSQFARIWLHTHPGESPTPSFVDEETFERVFGCCDWAVMFILARYGATYARLRFNVGPGGAIRIPVSVDYGLHFVASDHDAWTAEYERHIHRAASIFSLDGLSRGAWFDDLVPQIEDEIMSQTDQSHSIQESEVKP